MSDLQNGDIAPDFTLATDTVGDISLSGLKGQKVVLFFYPKDDTSGCTVEAKEFSALKDDFKALNCVIIGLSGDSVASHAKFRTKQDLSIILAADEDHTALEAYGVWQTKKNYGREYMGIVRSTYLIDEDGKIIEHWTKVQVKNHVQSVLDRLKDA
ncbi:MAG: peroxiredoxin [Rhizobiales bacterium]|nr:peroxiredoxin [Hyphomicrobiales bacterium]NRB12951.1 peroxiredoxin [Hyphomicrobiales bacterium]